jgi:hypothetical protein
MESATCSEGWLHDDMISMMFRPVWQNRFPLLGSKVVRIMRSCVFRSAAFSTKAREPGTSPRNSTQLARHVEQPRASPPHL